MGKWIADRYKIMKELGHGKNSTVYLCRDYKEDDIKNDVVAIKLYQSDDEDEIVENYFKREYDVLSMLRHKNIVSLLEQGYDKVRKAYFLVLEYVEGKTLGEIIKNNKLKNYNIELLIDGIFNAIEYAHNENVLHRDIKPSNIMITDDGEVKVIDFGISKILNSINTDGENYTVNALTFKYSSPEQKAGRHLTFQSDIYSLGIVLYEILSGCDFQSSELPQKQIAKAKNISNNRKAILSKMLEEDLEKRFSNIYTVINMWKSSRAVNKDKYSVSISTNAINKLAELRMIDGNNKTLAKTFIENDLKSDVYIASVKDTYNDESSDKYVLWGNQIEYNCALDEKNRNIFKIISINVPETYVIDKRKEMFGYISKIPFGVDLKKCISIEKLINEYGENRRKTSVINQEIKEKEQIIDKWQKILNIQKELISNNKNTLKYRQLTYDKESRRILLTIVDNIKDVEFTQDQILVLTTKSNRRSFKTKIAGYFNDFKNGILSIDIKSGVNVDEFSLSGEVSLDTAFMDKIIRKQEMALTKVKKSQCLNRNLSEILINPSISRSTYLSEDIILKNKNIAENRREIVEDALAAKDIYLLQGPPGTGKTTFISEVVYQQLKLNPKSKILVASQSNVAVNHAMDKIKTENQDVQVVRLGRDCMINDRMKDYTLEAQLQTLIIDIKEKTEKFFQHIKDKNFDSKLIENYNLSKEILDINDEIKKLNNSLEYNLLMLKNVKKEYTKNINYAEAINNIKDKLINISANVRAESQDIIDNFIDEYTSLGEEFIKKISKIPDIERNLELLNEAIEVDQEEIKKRQDELQVGFNLIGCNNINEVLKYNNDLKKKNEKIKTKYEQFSKLEKLKKEWIEKIQNTDELGKIFLEEVSVVGATCIGIANYSFNFDLNFDLVIIDEAGRATPPELLVPMVLGKKIILVGDHKQLPPIIDKVLYDEIKIKSEYRREDLEESLFEYLENRLNKKCKNLLKEQYRMHKTIGNLISDTFYGSNIISMADNNQRIHNFERFKDKNIVWMDTYKNDDKYEDSSIGNSKQNSLEANIIINLLNELENNYKNKEIKKSVSVITGYKGQKELIKRLIERNGVEYTNINIEIDTVDAFQGRETEIVIYSIVRSNKTGEIGFIGDARRLNVALSRAMELLILIGDSECIKKSNNNQFREVYDYILNNNNCIIEEV